MFTKRFKKAKKGKINYFSIYYTLLDLSLPDSSWNSEDFLPSSDFVEFICFVLFRVSR